MSAVDRLVEQRVAQLKVKLSRERKTPEQVLVGGLPLLRRERYALRRYTRQLASTARVDATREVVYLDPTLAQSMLKKGLVVSLDGRHPDHMFFLPNGSVLYLNRLDLQPEYQVPTLLAPLGKSLLDALLRMEGD